MHAFSLTKQGSFALLQVQKQSIRLKPLPSVRLSHTRQTMTSLIGKPAPANFELQNQHGELVKLSDLFGKKPVVLFFYPKDETAGCTAEVCAFRDQYEVFKDAGADVIGISSDSVDSHRQFSERQKLQYSLLSDDKGTLRKAFQVPTSFFGMFPGRVTYIIDRQGIVRDAFDSLININGHVKAAIKLLPSL